MSSEPAGKRALLWQGGNPSKRRKSSSRKVRWTRWSEEDSKLVAAALGAAGSVEHPDLEDQIAKDVKRTFRVRVDAALLTKFLIASALAEPDRGYVQGMNYVAGIVILVFSEDGLDDEAAAYATFSTLLRRFDGYYAPGFPVLLRDVDVLGSLLRKHKRDLCARLEACGATPMTYAPRFLMSLGSAVFDANVTARIWEPVLETPDAGSAIMVWVMMAVLCLSEPLVRRAAGDPVDTFVKVQDAILDAARGVATFDTIADAAPVSVKLVKAALDARNARRSRSGTPREPDERTPPKKMLGSLSSFPRTVRLGRQLLGLTPRSGVRKNNNANLDDDDENQPVITIEIDDEPPPPENVEEPPVHHPPRSGVKNNTNLDDDDDDDENQPVITIEIDEEPPPPENVEEPPLHHPPRSGVKNNTNLDDDDDENQPVITIEIDEEPPPPENVEEPPLHHSPPTTPGPPHDDTRDEDDKEKNSETQEPLFFF
ncbi:hypothetical protein CTAYLR_005438 [Chrysophaeum taylorii]|uniref:Rab-GAP TBC domain-containing protein n=1 Tax=Chrysophaeum taylorii TaxID=2483200 RepID=A0AAD7UM24_9STRA|nr:hypothetical protein CTAYLR_005438 [Chrysophaeum taylorii]